MQLQETSEERGNSSTGPDRLTRYRPERVCHVPNMKELLAVTDDAASLLL
jgi:hypothetical protein